MRPFPGRCSPCVLSAALLGAFALAEVVGGGGGGVDASSAAECDAIQADALDGLWTRFEGEGAGGPLRFWYFHGDGTGLYRYGKVGLNNTHSFDYRVVDDRLELTFRKPGDEHITSLKIVEREGERWLEMGDDPRDPGGRYKWVRAPLAADDADAPLTAHPIGDRLWIDYRNYATGGAGFAMYQFAPAGLDGRGVGWFHRGDFDEWSTESLSYRVSGDRVELKFELSGEQAETGFEIHGAGEERRLVVHEDPRDFWAVHRYADGGRSFGADLSAAFAPVLRGPR